MMEHNDSNKHSSLRRRILIPFARCRSQEEISWQRSALIKNIIGYSFATYSIKYWLTSSDYSMFTPPHQHLMHSRHNTRIELTARIFYWFHIIDTVICISLISRRAISATNIHRNNIESIIITIIREDSRRRRYGSDRYWYRHVRVLLLCVGAVDVIACISEIDQTKVQGFKYHCRLPTDDCNLLICWSTTFPSEFRWSCCCFVKESGELPPLLLISFVITNSPPSAPELLTLPINGAMSFGNEDGDISAAICIRCDGNCCIVWLA